MQYITEWFSYLLCISDIYETLNLRLVLVCISCSETDPSSPMFCCLLLSVSLCLCSGWIVKTKLPF